MTANSCSTLCCTGVRRSRATRSVSMTSTRGDCCVIPAGADFVWSGDRGLELLEVSLPSQASDGLAGA
jgi:hypothetical protein